VKCIKLRGEISDGFLFPVSYLKYLKEDISLEIGTELDSINGVKFCEKYIPPTRNYSSSSNNKSKKSKKKLEVPMFKEHFSTEHFMRNKHKIPAGTVCYIEEKIHGTSHRSGRVIYVTENPIRKIKRFVWNLFSTKKEGRLTGSSSVSSWEYINGTRRVIHSPEKRVNPYHENTMREEVLDKVKGLLFKGEQLYLELFGYEKTGSHIQKGFPYGCEAGNYRSLLYRITMNNEDGKTVDYNREYVYNRAEELGFEKPHLFEKFYYLGTDRSLEILEEKVIAYAQGQSEMAKDTLKEGVVVWFIDRHGKWVALKYKSDAFRLGESKLRDEGVVDQEDLN
jgi:hypothetical protein